MPVRFFWEKLENILENDRKNLGTFWSTLGQSNKNKLRILGKMLEMLEDVRKPLEYFGIC